MHTARTVGFSLLEVVVVVAILILVALIGASALSGVGISEVVAASAQTVAGAFEEARARTLSSENATQYGVHVAVGESQVTLFQGATYAPADPNNIIFSFDPRTFISETTLGATADVVFTRLTGTSTALTVTIAHEKDDTATAIVELQATGLVGILE